MSATLIVDIDTGPAKAGLQTFRAEMAGALKGIAIEISEKSLTAAVQRALKAEKYHISFKSSVLEEDVRKAIEGGFATYHRVKLVHGALGQDVKEAVDKGLLGHALKLDLDPTSRAVRSAVNGGLVGHQIGLDYQRLTANIRKATDEGLAGATLKVATQVSAPAPAPAPKPVVGGPITQQIELSREMMKAVATGVLDSLGTEIARVAEKAGKPKKTDPKKVGPEASDEEKSSARAARSLSAKLADGATLRHTQGLPPEEAKALIEETSSKRQAMEVLHAAALDAARKTYTPRGATIEAARVVAQEHGENATRNFLGPKKQHLVDQAPDLPKHTIAAQEAHREAAKQQRADDAAGYKAWQAKQDAILRASKEHEAGVLAFKKRAAAEQAAVQDAIDKAKYAAHLARQDAIRKAGEEHEAAVRAHKKAAAKAQDSDDVLNAKFLAAPPAAQANKVQQAANLLNTGRADLAVQKLGSQAVGAVPRLSSLQAVVEGKRAQPKLDRLSALDVDFATPRKNDLATLEHQIQKVRGAATQLAGDRPDLALTRFGSAAVAAVPALASMEARALSLRAALKPADEVKAVRSEAGFKADGQFSGKWKRVAEAQAVRDISAGGDAEKARKLLGKDGHLVDQIQHLESNRSMPKSEVRELGTAYSQAKFRAADNYTGTGQKIYGAQHLVQNYGEVRARSFLGNDQHLVDAIPNLHKYASAHGNAAKATRDTKDAMTEAHSAARGLAGSMGMLWATWGNTAPLLVFGGIGAALRGVYEEGKKVEYQLAFVKGLSGGEATPAALDSAIKGSLVGTKEATDGLRALAQSGLNVKDSMAALPDVLALATVGEMQVGTAALAATGVAKAFHLDVGSSIGRVSDVLAKAAASSNASVVDLMESMKYASAAGSLYGQSLEEVAAAQAFLSERNVKGSMAGTTHMNMLKEIYNPSKKGGEALASVGINVDRLRRDGKTANEIIDEIRAKTAKLDSVGLSNFSAALFGERGQREGASLLRAGTGSLTATQKKLEGSDGFTRQVMGELSNTVEGSSARIKQSLSATFTDVFEQIKGPLQSFQNSLAAALGSDDFKHFLGGIAQGVISLSRFLVDHADTIKVVGVAYLSLRAGSTVLELFGNLSRAAAASSASLLANVAAAPQFVQSLAARTGAVSALEIAESRQKQGLTNLTTQTIASTATTGLSTVATTGATTATVVQTGATNVLSTAMKGATATAAALAAGTRLLLGPLNLVLGVGTAVYAMWTMMASNQDKARDAMDSWSNSTQNATQIIEQQMTRLRERKHLLENPGKSPEDATLSGLMDRKKAYRDSLAAAVAEASQPVTPEEELARRSGKRVQGQKTHKIVNEAGKEEILTRQEVFARQKNLPQINEDILKLQKGMAEEGSTRASVNRLDALKALEAKADDARSQLMGRRETLDPVKDAAKIKAIDTALVQVTSQVKSVRDVTDERRTDYLARPQQVDKLAAGFQKLADAGGMQTAYPEGESPADKKAAKKAAGKVLTQARRAKEEDGKVARAEARTEKYNFDYRKEVLKTQHDAEKVKFTLESGDLKDAKKRGMPEAEYDVRVKALEVRKAEEAEDYAKKLEKLTNDYLKRALKTSPEALRGDIDRATGVPLKKVQAPAANPLAPWLKTPTQQAQSSGFMKTGFRIAGQGRVWDDFQGSTPDDQKPDSLFGMSDAVVQPLEVFRPQPGKLLTQPASLVTVKRREAAGTLGAPTPAPRGAWVGESGTGTPVEAVQANMKEGTGLTAGDVLNVVKDSTAALEAAKEATRVAREELRDLQSSPIATLNKLREEWKDKIVDLTERDADARFKYAQTHKDVAIASKREIGTSADVALNGDGFTSKFISAPGMSDAMKYQIASARERDRRVAHENKMLSRAERSASTMKGSDAAVDATKLSMEVYDRYAPSLREAAVDREKASREIDLMETVKANQATKVLSKDPAEAAAAKAVAVGADAKITELKMQVSALDEVRNTLEKMRDTEMEGRVDQATAIAERQSTIGYGMKQFFDNYRRAGVSNAKVVDNVMSQTFSSMEAGLMRFVETGKGGYKALTRSILADAARMAANQAVTKTLGGLFSLAGSAISRLVNAGRATGGAIYPNTLHPVNENGPELLQVGNRQYLMGGDDGGFVTPLSRASSASTSGGGSGGTVVNLSVNVASSGETSTKSDGSAEKAGQLGKIIEQAVLTIIARERRNGGLLSPA